MSYEIQKIKYLPGSMISRSTCTKPVAFPHILTFRRVNLSSSLSQAFSMEGKIIASASLDPSA